MLTLKLGEGFSRNTLLISHHQKLFATESVRLSLEQFEGVDR